MSTDIRYSDEVSAQIGRNCCLTDECQCIHCRSARAFPDTALALSFEHSARMHALAEEGRYLIEQELAAYDDLLIGPAVDELLSESIPRRAARRMQARSVIVRCALEGRTLAVIHGSLRCLPPSLQGDLDALVNEYAVEIGDVLDDTL
jgi:hypothetical protein